MAVSLWLIVPLMILSLAVLPFFLLLLASAVASLCSGRRADEPSPPFAERFLVVIPAHDEEAGIAETVRACRAMDYPSGLFQVLVIADNCTDGTAAVARHEGATVFDRNDPSRKSKGYAIEALIERLQHSGELESWNALVVIDADSTPSANLLEGFAGRLRRGQDWIQCFYAVANPDASWRTRLMAYAFALFNGVSPLGLWTLGLSAGFRGNGMCLSTRGLERVPWRSYGLVEDMEYSWNVRIAGGKVAFLPWAEVRGVMLGQGGKPAVSQRQRWEHGRRQIRNRMLPPLLRSSSLGWPERLCAAIELAMPPMAELLLVYLLILAGNLALWLTGWAGGLSAIVLTGLALLMSVTLAVYAVCPFLVFRLPWSYLRALAYLPFYLAWKTLIRLKPGPDRWVRTEREQAVNG